MSDANTEVTDGPFGADDDDDIEIIEVVGVDTEPREEALDTDAGDEVILDLDVDTEDYDFESDAAAVAALEPLPADTAFDSPAEAPIEIDIENDVDSEPAPATASEPKTLNDHERLLRLQADFQNFKRRTDKARERYEREANADLILRMLPVLDNFERALNAEAAGPENGLRAGVELTFRQILDELRKEGLTTIETVGKAFDPNFHEAVETETGSEHPPHTVTAELQRGYRLHGRLLRPALVKVAIDPSEDESQDELTRVDEES